MAETNPPQIPPQLPCSGATEASKQPLPGKDLILTSEGLKGHFVLTPTASTLQHGCVCAQGWALQDPSGTVRPVAQHLSPDSCSAAQLCKEHKDLPQKAGTAEAPTGKLSWVTPGQWLAASSVLWKASSSLQPHPSTTPAI